MALGGAQGCNRTVYRFVLYKCAHEWACGVIWSVFAGIQRSAPREDGTTRASRDARVTLEYTLLQGTNDDAVAARALSDFCKDLGTQWVHVNLMYVALVPILW